MSLQKPSKIRSNKITNAAKGEMCTLRLVGVCSFDADETVLAHLPGNKGWASKNHDIFACFACYSCHQKLDSGKVDAADQLRAFQETLLRLVDKGLIEIK